MHEDADCDDWKRAAPHSEHTVALPVEYVPTPHVLHEGEPESAVYRPGKHSEQSVEPRELWANPGAQSSHARDGSGEYLPLAHTTSAVAAAPQWRPLRHSVHAACP